jgi:hypothetical protein
LEEETTAGFERTEGEVEGVKVDDCELKEETTAGFERTEGKGDVDEEGKDEPTECCGGRSWEESVRDSGFCEDPLGS